MTNIMVMLTLSSGPQGDDKHYGNVDSEPQGDDKDHGNVD